jgi:PTS system glucose-specific IIA component
MTIASPCDGKIIKLSELKEIDELFSKEEIYDGFAIVPESTSFVSPIDGEVMSCFPTGHAYIIKNESEELECFLHIGINTYILNGEGFEVKVKQGNKIKQGEELCTFSLKQIELKNNSESKKTNLLYKETPVLFFKKQLKNKKVKVYQYDKIVKAKEVVAEIIES